MAGSKGYNAGSPVNLYFRSGAALTAANAITYAGLNGNGKLIDDDNMVEDPTELGDQEQSANVSSTPVYGKQTEVSVPGPASLPEYAFTFLLDNQNAIHTKLMALENSAAIELAVVTKTSDNAVTVDYMRGTVASVSKSTPVDAPQTGKVSVALQQNFKRINQA